MCLSKELIQHLADQITLNLEAKGLAKYDIARSAIAARVAEVLTRNMREEDQLNKDVEKLLAAHEAEISNGKMDYRKVFELTKQKLAKERGIVL